jgi:hypothetical protein
MSDAATKDDLDRAVTALRSEMKDLGNALRLEWRHEMLAQVRWQAGLIVVQFIATLGAVVAVMSFMARHV